MSKKKLLSILITLVLFVLLVNLGRLGIFGEDLSSSITAEMQHAFSAGSTGFAITLPRILCVLAELALVWLVCSVLGAIVSAFGKNSRGLTVTSLFLSIIKYVGVIVAVVWGLTLLGVNTMAVFASLGIVSLILGFGAQSLIEDVITGIFIIFEGQYNVGDIIVLDAFRGYVRRIGVRTTTIEDDGGNLKIVNNSDIRNIQNRSRNHSLAICDVGVEYDADLPAVERIVTAALPAMQAAHPQLYKAAPVYRGVQTLGDSSVVLRLTVECDEEMVFVAARQLNRDVLVLFQQNGVSIPFPQVTLSNRT